LNSEEKSKEECKNDMCLAEVEKEKIIERINKRLEILNMELNQEVEQEEPNVDNEESIIQTNIDNKVIDTTQIARNLQGTEEKCKLLLKWFNEINYFKWLKKDTYNLKL